MLKSPCLECEFKEEDKSGKQCIDCTKRLQYVYALTGVRNSLDIETEERKDGPNPDTRKDRIKRKRTFKIPSERRVIVEQVKRNGV